MSVQVAVRVRPFNQREQDLNSKLVIGMKGSTTTLKSIEDPKKDKDFTFDYSFWSHDDFTITEDGMNVPKSDKYADQQKVYEQVGKQVLDNAWEGYHCCLFAYGQTGAGKSYSMVGYKPNVGIVPIACREIFNRINNNENDKIEYEVYVSMLEIYNEKIQDLLTPINTRPSGGLKCRENKSLGFYAEGLIKVPVTSYTQIEDRMDEGQKNRTIASTQMNACSSRAHTIITIEFRQKEQLEDKKLEKFSVINLVDLAGSEKVGKTGASGDRLKEAGQINKSLHCLGMVISALADQEMGKKIKVPYRDSQLTKILCNALGGNSKTLMICAISPSHDNYDETLSTLRYADQAKKIKNKAMVNENETDRKIRLLTEENEALKRMIEEWKKSGGGAILKGGENLNEMQEQMMINANLVHDMQIPYQKQLEEAKEVEQIAKIDLTQPHLTNLNEDPILNNKIQFTLQEQFTFVGRQTGDPKPDIILNAMGIKRNHAKFENKDSKLYLIPNDQECGDFLFINGEKVFEKQQVFNLDRIIFGTGSAFLIKIPGGEPSSQDLPAEIDWEFAQDELTSKKDKKLQDIEEQNKKEKEEMEQQYKQQMEAFEVQKKQLEDKFLQEQEQLKLEKEKQQAETEMKEQIAKLEAERAQKELEREREKKRILDEESMKKYKIKEKHYLEHKLSKYLPKILEVNLIAKELKRNVSLSAKLAYYYQEACKIGEDQSKKLKIQIQVNNREDGCVYLWDLGKFSNRYYIIKDLLDRYFETNEIPNLSKTEDPFWDPPEPLLIGQGFLKLLSLGYLMDSPSELTLVGDNGACGTLQVNLVPTDEEGIKNIGEQMDEDGDLIDDPQELLGKRLDFNVVIDSAKLPNNFCNDTFVEYSLLTENQHTATYRTQTKEGKCPSPNYNYSHHHVYEKVSAELIHYLVNNTLCFKVFGFEQIVQTSTNSNKQQPVPDILENLESEEDQQSPPKNQKSQNVEEPDEIRAYNQTKQTPKQTPNQSKQQQNVQTLNQPKQTVLVYETQPKQQTRDDTQIRGNQHQAPRNEEPKRRSSTNDQLAKDDKKSKTGKGEKSGKKDDCTIF